MVRILIADDHEVVRFGVRQILEGRANWEVVAEASDGKEAVATAIETNGCLRRRLLASADERPRSNAPDPDARSAI
jgi:CheY-like chemotaxis protein